MSSSSPVRIVNPKPFLASLVSHRVSVVLKWGQEYRGTLLSSDSYINLQLGDCGRCARTAVGGSARGGAGAMQQRAGRARGAVQ